MSLLERAIKRKEQIEALEAEKVKYAQVIKELKTATDGLSGIPTLEKLRTFLETVKVLLSQFDIR